MKVLALMADAYGGLGGIAQFNRDQLDALSLMRRVRSVVSLSLLGPQFERPLPEKVEEYSSAGNSLRYVIESVGRGVSLRPDIIICGHVNLLPVAAVIKRLTGARLILNAHGIEVWERRGRVRSYTIRQVDLVLAVSRYTRRRLLGWSGLEPHRVKVIFDTIRPEEYRVAGKPAYLVERYGVAGKRILLTFGRLSASERYKGHDRVIALLPEIALRFPNLTYIIAGDGDDRARLESLTAATGMGGRVIFAGKISEEEKIDHYNLADAFAMPSTGEGFGIVFLEAAACGLPVLGGSEDGSRDALCDGALGVSVNPEDPEQLLAGLEEVMNKERFVPPALHSLAFPNFKLHLEELLGLPLGVVSA